MLNMDIFSIFFNMKVCCVFSLESPHRGDSNEYTQYAIFNIKKKVTLNDSKSAAMGFYSKGLKNEFETAVANEPSVFEPLKFYCTYSVSSLLLFTARATGLGFDIGPPSFLLPMIQGQLSVTGKSLYCRLT